MASEKILAKKQEVIDEIKSKVQDSSSVVIFTYTGLTDEDAKKLRRSLKESGSDYKVYKNTLMARAFNDLKIDLNEHLTGSSALAFGPDAVAPTKALADFAKTHEVVTLKVGIVDGAISDSSELAKLATIPSREGLLTMLAAGMMGIPKDLSICLDLYAKQKEEN
jgi:large subunit ribosomal protein L10